MAAKPTRNGKRCSARGSLSLNRSASALEHARYDQDNDRARLGAPSPVRYQPIAFPRNVPTNAAAIPGVEMTPPAMKPTARSGKIQRGTGQAVESQWPAHFGIDVRLPDVLVGTFVCLCVGRQARSQSMKNRRSLVKGRPANDQARRCSRSPGGEGCWPAKMRLVAQRPSRCRRPRVPDPQSPARIEITNLASR